MSISFGEPFLEGAMVPTRNNPNFLQLINIYIIESYSVIKRDNLLLDAWIHLKNIMLNKRSHIQSTNLVWFHSYEILGKAPFNSDRKQTSGCLGRDGKSA